MRLFIAIKISPIIIKEIVNFFNVIKNAEPNVKWEKEENIHITIKFLGDVNDHQLKEIDKSLKQINGKPATLELKGLGAFPNINSPNVLWVGSSGDVENIINLQKNIETEMSKLNFKKEGRPFKPHLTIGRVKNKINLETKIFFDNNHNKKFGNCIIDKFYLVESTLTPKGSLYNDLFEYGLQ